MKLFQRQKPEAAGLQLALNSRPRVLLLCQSAQAAAAEDLKLVIPGINRMNHDEQLQCHEIYSISSWPAWPVQS